MQIKNKTINDINTKFYFFKIIDWFQQALLNIYIVSRVLSLKIIKEGNIALIIYIHQQTQPLFDR
jgi:hypothetical protein